MASPKQKALDEINKLFIEYINIDKKHSDDDQTVEVKEHLGHLLYNYCRDYYPLVALTAIDSTINAELNIDQKKKYKNSISRLILLYYLRMILQKFCDKDGVCYGRFRSMKLATSFKKQCLILDYHKDIIEVCHEAFKKPNSTEASMVIRKSMTECYVDPEDFRLSHATMDKIKDMYCGIWNSNGEFEYQPFEKSRECGEYLLNVVREKKETIYEGCWKIAYRVGCLNIREERLYNDMKLALLCKILEHEGIELNEDLVIDAAEKVDSNTLENNFYSKIAEEWRKVKTLDDVTAFVNSEKLVPKPQVSLAELAELAEKVPDEEIITRQLNHLPPEAIKNILKKVLGKRKRITIKGNSAMKDAFDYLLNSNDIPRIIKERTIEDLVDNGNEFKIW